MKTQKKQVIMISSLLSEVIDSDNAIMFDKKNFKSFKINMINDFGSMSIFKVTTKDISTGNIKSFEVIKSQLLNKLIEFTSDFTITDYDKLIIVNKENHMNENETTLKDILDHKKRKLMNLYANYKEVI